MQAIIQKVIDNIQVSITNIHLRCEYENLEDGSPLFDFGVTMEKLAIDTIDESGKVMFLDRSIEKNKQLAMFKKLKLENLGVYFNTVNSKSIVNSQKAIDFIKKENDWIGVLNFTINVKQNMITQDLIKSREEQIKVSGNIAGLDLNVNQRQLKSIMQLMEYVGKFRIFQLQELEKIKYRHLRPFKKIRNEKDKHEKKVLIRRWWLFARKCVKYSIAQGKGQVKKFEMTDHKKRKMKKKFMEIFEKLQKNEKKENLAELTQKERDVYSHIIECLDTDQLQVYVDETMKKIQKELAIAEKKIEKNKKGYFKGWFSSHPEVDVTQEEKENIEKFIDSTFSVVGAEGLIIPNNQAKIVLSVDFQYISIYVNYFEKIPTETKGIFIALNGIHAGLTLYAVTKLIKLNVKDFSFDAGSVIDGKEERSKILLKDSNLSSEIDCLMFSLVVDPFEDEKTNLKLSIEIAPISIQFYFGLVELLKNLIDFQATKAVIIQASKNALSELQNTAKARVAQMLLSDRATIFEIKLNKLTLMGLVEPGVEDTSKFVFSIDSFIFQSQKSRNLKNEAEFYETFHLNLTDIVLYYDPKKSSKYQKLSLFEKCSMKFTIDVLKGGISEVMSDKPLVKIGLNILSICLNVEKFILSEVQAILNQLEPPKKKSSFLSKLKEKKEIFDQSNEEYKSDQLTKEQKEEEKLNKIDLNEKEEISDLEKMVYNCPLIRYHAKIHALQLKILRTVEEEKFFPIFTVDLHQFKAHGVVNKNMEMVNSFLVGIESYFFNSFIGVWEPIIELVFFEIGLFKGKKLTLCIELQQQSSCINLNISRKLLILLMQFKTELSSLNSKENCISKNVFPYQIVNETGYKLKLIDNNQTTFDIEHNKFHAYLAPQQLDNNEKDKLLNFGGQICHPDFKRPFLFNKRFNLTQIIPKKIYLQKTNNMYIVMKTQLDAETFTKTIVFSSLVRIHNYTKRRLLILLSNVKDEKNIEIEPDESCGIPFDKIDEDIKFSFENNNFNNLAWYSLKKLREKENNFEIQLKMSSNSFILMHLIKDKMNFGAVDIEIRPLLVLKNVLPFPLSYELMSTRGSLLGEIECQASKEIYEIDLLSSSFFKIKLNNYEWSEVYKLFYSKKSEVPNTITLTDLKKNTGIVSISQIKNEKSNFTLVFWANVVILNETEVDLEFYMKNSKFQTTYSQIGGGIQNESNSNKMFLGKSIDYIYMKAAKKKEINNNKNNDSNEILVGTLATTILNISNYDHTKFIFSVTTSLYKCDEKYHIFTKCITVLPRFVCYNKTIFPVKLIQTNNFFKILPFQKIPLLKFNNEECNALSVEIELDEKLFQNKFGIEINELGVSTLLLKTQNGDVLYSKFNICIEKGIIFIIIEQISESPLHLKIVSDFQQNSIDKINIYQTKNEDYCIKCGPKCSIGFAWTNLLEEKTICFELIKNSIVLGAITTDFNKINKKSFFNINNDIYVQIIINIIGPMKVLFLKQIEKSVFEENTKKKAHHEANKVSHQIEKSHTQIKINIKAIGISIIIEYLAKRQEVTFILFENIEMIMLISPKTQQVQFRIGFLNIDNNHDLITRNPVVLTAKNMSEMRGQNLSEHLVNFLMIKRNDSASDMIIFDKISLEIKPILIYLEESFINSILFVYQKVLEDFGYGLEVKYLDKYFIKNIELIQKNGYLNKLEWDIILPKVSKMYLYFKSFSAQPLEATVSFHRNVEIDAKEKKLNVLADSIGNIVGNIENLSINLDGLSLEHIYDSTKSVTDMFIYHYKNCILKHTLRVLGAAEFLGNPVGLFKNIGSGLVDIYDKPRKGFINGPLEGGLGILVGGKSFILKTVGGISNSVAKITGSMGSGVSALTMDQPFLIKREKMKKKHTKKFVSGVGQGFLAFGTGLGSGLAGIILKPYEGVRDDGIKGLVVGVLKGTTGVLTKTTTGFLDLTSKIAEGIKVSTIGEEINYKRIRYPRPLYTELNFISRYNLIEAKNYYFFKRMNEGRFSNMIFMFSEQVYSANPDVPVILVGASDKLLFFIGKKIDWEINVENIKKISKKNNKIFISLHCETRILTNLEVFIICSGEDQALRIQEILNHYRISL